MKQPIVEFVRDEEGHWVARLACGHQQHMRHEPPFVSRPWVLTEEGRRSRVGQELDCLKCGPDEPFRTGSPADNTPGDPMSPGLSKQASALILVVVLGVLAKFAMLSSGRMDDSGVATSIVSLMALTGLIYESLMRYPARVPSRFEAFFPLRGRWLHMVGASFVALYFAASTEVGLWIGVGVLRMVLHLLGWRVG